MKVKLKKFNEFADDILPHEVSYLIDNQKFDDKVKLHILERIAQNCNSSNNYIPYDSSIDKRKYSHLKNWIETQLSKIDVDKHFEWINEMDRKVMTDSISLEEERILLKAVQTYDEPIYYFSKFYELVLNFRNFLLIRLRYDEHKFVNDFIEKQKVNYNISVETNQKLHEASVDIINQYALNNTESSQWETWLFKVFDDEQMDGRNRYFAVVRLTFMYFNYREYEKLSKLYEQLDILLSQGKFYSRRILFNYYANSLLLYSKFDVLQRAEEFGYLSIKQKNPDRLQYLNNYSAILLRQGKIDKALELMKQSMPEMKNTDNFHNKIGFASFYVKCLNMNGQPEDAEHFAEHFFKAYKQQILSQRWHIFFVAYLQSLILQEKYEELLKLTKKYSILEKDKTFQSSIIYLPSIVWYEALARYMGAELTEKELVETLANSAKGHMGNPHKNSLIQQLIKEINPQIPYLIKQIKSMLEI